jgi:PAS domain S-box-containing protein
MHISEQNNPLVSHRINMTPPSKRVVILLDQRGIFDCNSTALAVLGFDRKEDLLGKHLYYFSPRYQPSGQGSVSLSLDYMLTALREGSCRFNWLFRRPIGSEFLAEVSLTATEMHSRKTLRMNIRYIGDRQPSEFKVDLLGATKRLAKDIDSNSAYTSQSGQRSAADSQASEQIDDLAGVDLGGSATEVGQVEVNQSVLDRDQDLTTTTGATDTTESQLGQSEQLAQPERQNGNSKLDPTKPASLGQALAEDDSFAIAASEFAALEAFINEEIANSPDLDLTEYDQVDSADLRANADLADVSNLSDLGAASELEVKQVSPHSIPAPQQPLVEPEIAIANGDSISITELPGFSPIEQIAPTANQKRNQNFLRQIGLALDHSAEPICITTSKGKVVHINQAFRTKFGYSLSQLTQIGAVGIFHPPLIDAVVVDLIFQAIADHNAWHGEITIQSQNGQRVVTNMQVNVIRQIESQISGLICLFDSDRANPSGLTSEQQSVAVKIAEAEQAVAITSQIAQLKAQKLVLEGEISGRLASNSNASLQLGAALENTSDAIGITDINGIATYTNRAFFELFGYSQQRLQKPGALRELFPNPAILDSILRIISGGGAWNDEIDMHHRNGRVLPVAIRADGIRDQGGKVSGRSGCLPISAIAAWLRPKLIKPCLC